MPIFFPFRLLKKPNLYNCSKCKNTGRVEIEKYCGDGRVRVRRRLVALIRHKGGIGPIYSIKPTYCICHCPHGGLHEGI